MAALVSNFYNQIKLSTLKSLLQQSTNTELEFWYVNVKIHSNLSNFIFDISEPKKNKLIKKAEKISYESELIEEGYKCIRFKTKEEAENFITLTTMKIYAPIKAIIDDKHILDKFQDLINKSPEKIIKEYDNILI